DAAGGKPLCPGLRPHLVHPGQPVQEAPQRRVVTRDVGQAGGGAFGQHSWTPFAAPRPILPDPTVKQLTGHEPHAWTWPTMVDDYDLALPLPIRQGAGAAAARPPVNG